MNRQSEMFKLTDDERHRIGLVLTGSTPAQRIQWLEAMRLMFGAEHLKKARDLKWRLQDEPRPLNPPPPSDR